MQAHANQLRYQARVQEIGENIKVLGKGSWLCRVECFQKWPSELLNWKVGACSLAAPLIQCSSRPSPNPTSVAVTDANIQPDWFPLDPVQVAKGQLGGGEQFEQSMTTQEHRLQVVPVNPPKWAGRIELLLTSFYRQRNRLMLLLWLAQGYLVSNSTRFEHRSSVHVGATQWKCSTGKDVSRLIWRPKSEWGSAWVSLQSIPPAHMAVVSQTCMLPSPIVHSRPLQQCLWTGHWLTKLVDLRN